MQHRPVGHFDQHFAVGQEPLHVPLQRVAQVDGDGQFRTIRVAQPLAQRQQVGDARDLHGHGMHVDPDHLVQAALQGGARVQPLRLGFRQQASQGVEQERAGAAGRVQHALLQRTLDSLRAHAGRQPVGRVVLAQVVPVLRIHQRFVEALEHVGLDLAQPETPHVAGDAPHQVGSHRRGQNPIKEVGFHHAAHAGLLERTARQQVGGFGRGQPQHVHGDGLGHHREVGVLEEEVVAVHRRSVDQFQPLRPELALEARFGLRAHRGPGLPQVAQRAIPGGALAAQFAYHRFRLGVQVVAGRHGGAEPDQQVTRFGGFGPVGPEFAQPVVAQFVRDELRAVRGDAHVAGVAVRFALFDVALELTLGVVALAPEVALELHDGSAQERVDSSPDFRDALFQLHVVARHAEAVDEKLQHSGPYGLMPGPPGQSPHDLVQLLAAQPAHPPKAPPVGPRATIPTVQAVPCDPVGAPLVGAFAQLIDGLPNRPSRTARKGLDKPPRAPYKCCILPPVASVAGSRPPHRAVSVFIGRSRFREAPGC